MGRKKNAELDFHFCEIPAGSSALILPEEPWEDAYGPHEESLHFHNLFELGCCRSGRGRLILDGEELPYEGAVLSAAPANCPHSSLRESGEAWEYVYFEPRELIREIFPDNPIHQELMFVTAANQPLLLRAEEHPELAGYLERLLWESWEKRRYSQELIRGLLKLCLLELIRIQEGRKSLDPGAERSHELQLHITPALRYIEEHCDRNLRVSDLARECGLSEPHFRRLFAQSMNMPPLEYLNLARVRLGCKLISTKEIPMDLLAAECGFSSTSAFTRNFKKFLGTTPYQWKLQRERRGFGDGAIGFPPHQD
ncbi:MAG: helix-turn-helix transcriptional regulator [Oscillospiraceae bacterium]|nr:helix-turn-helix transcriptional regulator [Oscillospiraceae bacterium]